MRLFVALRSSRKSCFYPQCWHQWSMCNIFVSSCRGFYKYTVLHPVSSSAGRETFFVLNNHTRSFLTQMQTQPQTLFYYMLSRPPPFLSSRHRLHLDSSSKCLENVLPFNHLPSPWWGLNLLPLSGASIRCFCTLYLSLSDAQAEQTVSNSICFKT